MLRCRTVHFDSYVVLYMALCLIFCCWFIRLQIHMCLQAVLGGLVIRSSHLYVSRPKTPNYAHFIIDN